MYRKFIDKLKQDGKDIWRGGVLSQNRIHFNSDNPNKNNFNTIYHDTERITILNNTSDKRLLIYNKKEGQKEYKELGKKTAAKSDTNPEESRPVAESIP